MSGRLTFTGQQFAAAAEMMYEDRLTIRRPTSTTGPHGGQIPGGSPTVLASDVPCRLRPANANEIQLAGATQGTLAQVVRFPAWQGETVIEIDSKCELLIAARGNVAAQTLHAVAPLPNQGLWIEVLATRQI